MVISHSKFIKNTGSVILELGGTNTISVTHSEFLDNAVTEMLVYSEGVMITISQSEFVKNTANFAIVYLEYYTTVENITNNVFTDNSEAYELVIGPFCRSDLSLSLESSRCIQCPDHWHRNLIGIVIAAFIAGIALY